MDAVTPFGKILVANRGEIAVRVMRTCREMGIGSVAVWSDADEHALHVRAADESVRLAGDTARDTYLRGDLIVAAAQATGADAVHPGYGFLSENAEFAELVDQAGLVFIGPPAPAIAAMGSKTEAKRIMTSAGVPTLPSFDLSGLDTEAISSAAERVGYPLLVKAAAGGGGKGMRIVREPGGLGDAVASASREAMSSFGDASVLLERFLERARHVEIQIVADIVGTTVHLFERECSVQRRYQKIIEETPSPAVGDELRARMGKAAVAAAEAVSYVGAGTVEFLVANDEFFFLEMNTRLQVEHPVTEAVTGLDLVREQVRIAAGEPLSTEIRTAAMTGHAIEARLYAEDPAADFLPVAGRLERFRIEGPVRVDAGVEDNSDVPVFYDPMLAKVISHGRTREHARSALVAALRTAQLHGIATNREFLVGVLESEPFTSAQTTTTMLEDLDIAALSEPLVGDLRPHAIAATIAGQAGRRAAAPVLQSAPSGFRNAPSQLQVQEWVGPRGPITVGYRFSRTGLIAEVDGSAVDIVLHQAGDTEVDATIDGIRRRYVVHRVHRNVWVTTSAGDVGFVQVSRFPPPVASAQPGSLTAPMPGRVVQVLVEEGQEVAADEPILIIEAMKMEHTVRAPHAGQVTAVGVSTGDQVVADQTLAVVHDASS